MSGDCADLFRNLLLIRAEQRIAVFFIRVVAMHAANGPFSHVTRNDQHAFFDQVDQLAEIAIGK